jgi:hypothetical protein
VAEVTEDSKEAKAGESAVELGGYQPELKPTLGSFQVFAISFAFISVAVGIFATYDVLQNAGPVGIWLWVIAAVGQTAGCRTAEAHRGSDNPPGDHLRLHGGPLPRGAQTTRSKEGRVRPRALRAAGRDRRAGVVSRRAVCTGIAPRGYRPRPGRGRLAHRGSALYFLRMLIFDRQTLETEPGDVSVFKH